MAARRLGPASRPALKPSKQLLAGLGGDWRYDARWLEPSAAAALPCKFCPRRRLGWLAVCRAWRGGGHQGWPRAAALLRRPAPRSGQCTGHPRPEVVGGVDLRPQGSWLRCASCSASSTGALCSSADAARQCWCCSAAGAAEFCAPSSAAATAAAAMCSRARSSDARSARSTSPASRSRPPGLASSWSRPCRAAVAVAAAALVPGPALGSKWGRATASAAAGSLLAGQVAARCSRPATEAASATP